MKNMMEPLLMNVEKLLKSDVLRNYEVADNEMDEMWTTIYKQIRQLRLDASDAPIDRKFYTEFENRIDYSMNMYDRGLTLDYFIYNNPQFKGMFDKTKPEHFSQIPLAARYQYEDYLLKIMKDDGYLDTMDEYTELVAICDYAASIWLD